MQNLSRKPLQTLLLWLTGTLHRFLLVGCNPSWCTAQLNPMHVSLELDLSEQNGTLLSSEQVQRMLELKTHPVVFYCYKLVADSLVH